MVDLATHLSSCRIEALPTDQLIQDSPVLGRDYAEKHVTAPGYVLFCVVAPTGR